MIEKDLRELKPRIRLIRTNGGSIYECKSRESKPGSSRSRYGYGDSIRSAYMAWQGITSNWGYL